MTMHSEHAPSSGAIDPIGLALEVAVYAPIGAAAYLAEVGPDFVRMVAARGRAEVEVRQEQVATRVRHAKGAVRSAIAFGLPHVRKRVEKRLASLRSRPAAQPAPKPAAPPAAPDRLRRRPVRPRRPRRRRTRRGPTAIDGRRDRVHPRRHEQCSHRNAGRDRGRGAARDSGLRRALGVAGGRTARGSERRRAGRGTTLRNRSPAAAHDPRQDRTALQLTAAAAFESARRS